MFNISLHILAFRIPTCHQKIVNSSTGWTSFNYFVSNKRFTVITSDEETEFGFNVLK